MYPIPQTVAIGSAPASESFLRARLTCMDMAASSTSLSQPSTASRICARAHDLPGVAGEVLADGVLGGRERHGLAAHGEAARPEVDPHLPEGEGVRARPALTA